MLRLASLILLAFVAANGALLALVERTGILDQPIDVQTRAMYEARLRHFFSRESASPRAVFLGDSLMFGAHLKEREGAGWAGRTLPGQFAEKARAGKRYAALNLGVNGVLFSELSCMTEDVLAAQPELLVINVSPRPFSADFKLPITQTERAFLCPPPGLEARTRSLLGRVVPVIGVRDLAQFAWLGVPPRPWLMERLLRGLDDLGGRVPEPQSEEDLETAEVMADMAWRLKAAARYNSIAVADDHPQMAALRRLFRLLARQTRTRVLVLYVEENTAPIAAQLDRAHYDQVSAAFARRMEDALRGVPQATFVQVPAEELAGHYVDHIHLDSVGYGLLAQRVSQLLER